MLRSPFLWHAFNVLGVNSPLLAAREIRIFFMDTPLFAAGEVHYTEDTGHGNLSETDRGGVLECVGYT